MKRHAATIPAVLSALVFLVSDARAANRFRIPDQFDAVDEGGGELSFAVVFDTSGPAITRHLRPGTDLEILRLTVDVLSTSPAPTTLDLRDGTPPRVNAMTGAQGFSVSPPPALLDGDLTCVSGNTVPGERIVVSEGEVA